MVRGKRFFKHDVKVLEYLSVPNGSGGTTKKWTPTTSFNGFMDTPKTDKQLYAMQMQKSLDRELYFSSTITIPSKVRFEFENVQYEPSGAPVDQGGQGEIYCLPLKKVT